MVKTCWWRSTAMVAVAGVLALSGCSSNSNTTAGPETTTRPETTTAAPEASTTPVQAEKVDEIAATVPDDIKNSGKLTVSVNVPYAPIEFKDPDGQLVGFDVDLMNAIAATLGLTAEYSEADFDKIIPSVADGTYNVGMSSITDTKEREKSVDFVNYFSAGTLWAQRPGESIDPNNACGKKVSVFATTMQETEELPAKSKACTDAGKPAIEIVKFDNQDAATNAVVLGQADAMSADSPVTAYAIKQSEGKLEAAGEIFDSAPYGWPVAKDSPLAQSLLKALEHLMQTGDYKTIAANWGVESGMIDKPMINGATS